jgi:hypothetical protein
MGTSGRLDGENFTGAVSPSETMCQTVDKWMERRGTAFAFTQAGGSPVTAIPMDMKFWGGKTPPSWSREIANDRPRQLLAAEYASTTPQTGDVVLKPFIGSRTHQQRFRVETWNTHDLLDGPFNNLRQAMDAAFELGATARLTVWLDYSHHPEAHELDRIPLCVGSSVSGYDVA